MRCITLSNTSSSVSLTACWYVASVYQKWESLSSCLFYQLCKWVGLGNFF